ncbi:dynein heavy chain 8, axonemal isoform X4 [Orussus abietinus]|nr:dynein heavy chain 8, axonemal isoform X4 [Orussus abietinus]
MVAYILNTSPSVLEEGIIDKHDYVNTFSSFFASSGRQAIIIHYQPMESPAFETGRWTAQLARETEMLRCCVTDGSTEKFRGKCVIVYRLRSGINFELKQLLEETYYAYVEVNPKTGNSLAGISDLICQLNEPAIIFNTQWHELLKSEAGHKTKQNFIGDFKDFSEFLSVTKIDLDGAIKFEINWDLYELLSEATESEGSTSSATNFKIIQTVEAHLKTWMNIMQRAIVESQQLRRETETVGPSAELTYWKRILAKFSSIMEHVKAPHTQTFLQFLVQSKSKLMKEWKRLENHINTIQILSQDNVNYLYALEKFTQPLYRLDPTKIGSYLPSLMYALRMIYATSRFFNTRRMVTAVFVKVLLKCICIVLLFMYQVYKLKSAVF